MNSSKRNRWQAVTKLCALGTLAGCIVAHVFGQQSTDDLFGRAVELFNQGKYEDACDLITQVVQRQPTDRGQTFQKIYCSQKKAMLDSEKRFFDEGMKFAASGSCDDAKEDYDRISHLSTKDPKYRNQLNSAVSDCESKQGERAALDRAASLLREYKFAEARNSLTTLSQRGGAMSTEAEQQIAALEQAERDRNQEARALFAHGKDDEARARLTQVAADRGQPSNDAQQLLAQISQVEANDRKSLDQAAYLAKQGKNAEAQSLLDQVVARKGPLSAQAASLLKEIAGTGEQFLRAGLKAYFRGDLEEAEKEMTSYLSINGEHDALAYFFRGAARASRYFLAGEADIHQKNDAVEDFRTVKQRHGDFRLPLEYISPKVLSLYQTADQQLPAPSGQPTPDPGAHGTSSR